MFIFSCAVFIVMLCPILKRLRYVVKYHLIEYAYFKIVAKRYEHYGQIDPYITVFDLYEVIENINPMFFASVNDLAKQLEEIRDWFEKKFRWCPFIFDRDSGKIKIVKPIFLEREYLKEMGLPVDSPEFVKHFLV